MESVDVSHLKTVVVGADGYLGRHLLSAYRQRAPESLGTSRRGKSDLHHWDFLASSPASLDWANRGYTHAAVTAAVTSIGFAERHPDEAWAVNVEGTLDLARKLVNQGITPILFSSDYVFDGVSGGYEDDAPTNPSTVYGQTKAALEHGLPQMCGKNYLLIRLSKLFGFHRGDGTLLDEMAETLVRGEVVRAAEDQVFCPTYVDDAVRAIMALQAAGARGTFNVCLGESWSRYDLASSLAEKLSVDPAMVRRICLEDLDEPFTRPKRTTMVCRRLSKARVYFMPMSECLGRVAAGYQSASVMPKLGRRNGRDAA